MPVMKSMWLNKAHKLKRQGFPKEFLRFIDEKSADCGQLRPICATQTSFSKHLAFVCFPAKIE